MTASPLLSFVQVSKQFAGTLAVDGVSLEVYGGEILALLGQNGAGKSTLIKMLAGVHLVSAGQILLKGQPLDSYAHPPIAFIHQDLGLIEWMTVAENLSLGMSFPRRLGLIDYKACITRAEAALEKVGGGISPQTRVSRLSRTERSLVAIARALAQEAELLVLDEPTSSLPAADVERLFAVLRSLRAKGVGMIYVSHRLDEIFRISDRIAVMRDGRLVGVRKAAQTNPEELVMLIVGHKLAEMYPKAPQPSRAGAILELNALRTQDTGPVSLRLQPGEMLGLTGLKGAGQVSVGRALFGLEPVLSGNIQLQGKPCDLSSPQRAMEAGIGFTPANRQEESLAMPLSVRENFFMNPSLQGATPLSLIRPAQERLKAATWVKRYGVRPADGERSVDTLSGGNQQKVVMGRWLEFSGQVLVLEEPTLGVDVGSKAEIYGLLAQALEQGKAVVLVSTDFEEIANLCHRALIFNQGQIVAELKDADLTVPALVLHAAGGQPRPQSR
ncbi:MAG: sugar ABC transporter ATP-binding protein [Thermaceae bacterium]|nr:sugar ABC transporter ATP-binding protein [Thermaceae bacterium]